MSSDRKEVLCTRCPKGCRLKLKVEDDEVVVRGYECKLGEEYGKQEGRNPKRVVPTTVRIRKGRWPRLPVRTDDTIPLDKIDDVMDEIRGLVLDAPVKKGDIVMENVAGTSVSMIAERDMERVNR
ncbi:MAG: DUF1667 domain-containing protein [Thermoplasmatota archaeon]